MPLNYSLSDFESLYEAIQSNDSMQIDILVRDLSEDLKDLNATYPHKNDKSRAALESKKLQFSTGEQVEVNQDFVLLLVQLSDDLNLDELVSAELIYQASNDYNLGTSLVDSAKATFYLRRQTILSISSYILNAGNNKAHVKLISSVDNFFKSLKLVETELGEIKNLVKRSKLLGIYNSIYFQQDVKFRRNFLFKEHELLSEIFLGLVSSNQLDVTQFIALYNLLDNYDPDDLFMVHLLPGLFSYCSKISLDAQFHTIYDLLVKKDLLDLDQISGKPMKLCVILVFITYFTQWCNDESSKRSDLEFESTCSTPMSTSIELGAMEQLMCVAADTTAAALADSNEPLYDFRSLLQKFLPKLIPKQVLDIDEEATLRLKRKLQLENHVGMVNLDNDSLQVAPIYIENNEENFSLHFVSLFVPIFASFVETFIGTSLFMLTKLRDSEEDSLLSSDKFDLEEISKKAELERFFLTVYYLYSSRESLAARFWDKSSPLFGFIKWSSSSSNSALMRSTFCLMLGALSTGSRNAIETYNFLQSNASAVATSSSAFVIRNTTANLCWTTIYEDLVYYNKALSEPQTEEKFLLFGKTQANVVVELGEDAILFITGYFQLISQVASNNEQTKKELFESDDMELPNILKSFLTNDTSLAGPCLFTLRSLVSGNGDVKKKIWEIVENWIFNLSKARQYISKDASKLNIKKIFAQSLKSFDDILGFVNLMHDLLQPSNSDDFEQYKLDFPLGFGLESGRKQGLYPYFEFLIEEVFTSSTQPFLTYEQKTKLQKPLLSMFLNVLNGIQEKSLVEYSQYSRLSKLDSLFKDPLDFQTFVQLEPSSLVMNYLFAEGLYKLLLEIISLGIDEISDKPSDSPSIQILDLALSIIKRILTLQSYYIEVAIPIIKNVDNPLYIPTNVGSHGLRTFYDAIFFKLPIVAHLLLYVGSQHESIANVSLDILTKISESPRFNENTNGNNDRGILLTTFQTIDESERIKNAFIDQLSSEVDSDQNLSLKLRILKFLDKNLSNSRNEPTIAHFLLGFEFRAGNHLSEGDLSSERCLLKTLLFVLLSSMESMHQGENITHAPIKLAAATMEIVLKLCRNPISRHIVLPILRNDPEGNLFLKLVALDFNLDSTTTLFEGLRFNSVLSNENSFTQSQAIGALISFIQYRNVVSHFLLLELSSVARVGPLSLQHSYVKALVNGDEILNGAPKILTYLDILEFNFTKVVQPFEMPRFGDFDYNYILKRINLKDYDLLNPGKPIYDLTVLDQMANLNSIDYLSRISSVEDKKKLLESINVEKSNIERYLINYNVHNDFKTLQLSSLKSWALVIQVILTHGSLDQATRSGVILEVFQSILPKINDYIDHDITFAEALVSLFVLLYDQYDDSSEGFSHHVLFPIFRMCLYGLMSTHSTLELRSDLYVLANKYLKQIDGSKELVKELLQSLDLALNETLLKTIFNDSIIGDSSARVTSLLFLESLVKLSSQYDPQSIHNLLRSDYLALLVRSILKTDEMLTSCFESNLSEPKISLYGLLYELTLFKTTLYFLIRVAETRSGAYMLIQSDVFNIVKSCEVLKIDPDLGVNLKFDELNRDGQKVVLTNLSLDTPLRLPNEYHQDLKSNVVETTISLFEILVPLFQLLSAVTISMGPSNVPVRLKNQELLKQVEKLVVGTLKRDAILEDKQHIVDKESNNVYHNDVSLTGLRELTKQFTLLYSLIED